MCREQEILKSTGIEHPIMGRKTVALITAVWKRHELTALVLDRFRNIRDEIADTIDLELIAVGSEGPTSRKLCESRGFNYIEHDNMPLNHKFNAASRLARKFEPAAVILMGSDDWITSNAVTNSLEMLKKGLVAVGLLDLYFMDLATLRLGRWPGYGFFNNKNRIWAWRNRGKTVGVGRCFSYELMEELDWELWDPKAALSKWLDTNCDERIKALGHRIKGLKMADLGTFAVDIKGSDENVTPQTLSNLRIKWVKNAKSELYQHFPKEEVDSLIELSQSIN